MFGGDKLTGPRWMREHSKWGPSAWPIHWCEAVDADVQGVQGCQAGQEVVDCVVFLPVVFTRTTSGALFQALALVVVFALACSLLVALTLVPMLAARLRQKLETEAARPRYLLTEPGVGYRMASE